jgi:hypothetical protein
VFPTIEIECYIQKPVEIKDFEKNKCRARIIIVLAASLIVIIIINYRGKL